MKSVPGSDEGILLISVVSVSFEVFNLYLFSKCFTDVGMFFEVLYFVVSVVEVVGASFVNKSQSEITFKET